MPSKKIRIYELARELGVENQVVLDLTDELKMGVKSHSSSIEEAMADRVRRLADSKGLRHEEPPEPEPAPEPTVPAPARSSPLPVVPLQPAKRNKATSERFIADLRSEWRRTT